MGNLYGKNKVLYSGIWLVESYRDSLHITTYNFITFKISKSHENIQKISEIATKYNHTKRMFKFTYNSEIMNWFILTDISVVDKCDRNMKFVNKISYVHDKNFDELVFDDPDIFIINKNTNSELIPGSTYTVTYMIYVEYRLITSYTQVGFGNELVDKVEQLTKLEL